MVRKVFITAYTVITCCAAIWAVALTIELSEANWKLPKCEVVIESAKAR